MILNRILPLLLVFAFLLSPAACAAAPDLPAYSGEAVIALDNNRPDFSPDAAGAEDFIVYSELDGLGRVGPAWACLSGASLPTEPLGESGVSLPVGWVTARYDDLIDGAYLYSLCRLISPALGGAGGDARNVFTGTRFFRQEGMLPFEEEIADFLSRTSWHVLYRVTPVYQGDELVPVGVQMEAYSVEDAGRSVCFNVFVYNIQPGVTIDYRSGQSTRAGESVIPPAASAVLSARRLPPVTQKEAPTKTTFAALEESSFGDLATANASTRPAWIPENDSGIYHVNPNCGNMNINRARETTEAEAMKDHRKCTGGCLNY